MKHSFVCLEEDTVPYSEYLKQIPCKNGVHFRDDFIRYISDTLSWIPSIHLAGSQYRKANGLYFSGCAIINHEGASMLENVIQSWIKIFSTAPKSFELTGPVLVDINNKSTDEYYKVPVDRDLIVQSLTQLSSYAEKAKLGKHYILHVSP